MPTMPDWVRHARTFLATKRPEYLDQAIESCPDDDIRQFLQREEHTAGEPISPEVFEPIVERLKSEDRPTEAAILPMLGFRLIALMAEHPERFERETSEFATDTCQAFASQSHELGFPECEALFSRTLGTRALKKHQWSEAREFLEAARNLYRDLAATSPNLYRPDVAWTLNNLGTVLRDDRDFPGARKAYEEARDTYRDLAASEPHIYRPDVAMTLNNLGIVLSDERDFPSARKAYEEALEIRRDLATSEPHIYRRNVAMTLNNLGTVLSDERDFPGARKAYEEARDTYRDLATSEPHIYRPNVAITLNNLGTVLSAERDSPGARKAFEEARDTYRDLATSEPHIYRPYVATTLNNLGNVLSDDRNFPGARKAYEAALEIRRDLATSEPHIYRPYVATTLNNLGTVLRDERDFPGARKAFEAARDTYRDLAASEPHIYRPDVATTLNNLAGVLVDLKQHSLAGEVARQAVETAEKSEGKVSLAKGNAPLAYKLLLGVLAKRGSREGLFRCLAAMREGHVLALGEEPADRLEETRAELSRIEAQTKRGLRILVVESLDKGRTSLAVVSSDSNQPLVWEKARDFNARAEALFGEIGRVYLDPKIAPSYAESRSAVLRLGREAWESLPDSIQQTLDPKEPWDVLISGDSFWNRFPWEALVYDSVKDDFLGLQRPLVRWGPLSADALKRLKPRDFGTREPTVAIHCPWNVPGMNPLYFTQVEAGIVAMNMKNLGYQLVPDDKVWIGSEATPSAMHAMLSTKPTLLLYSGHGDILANEEVMAHWPESPSSSGYLPFGRTELEGLATRTHCERLLDNGPLVVLNACRTGTTRSHGGQREDLAWAFMQHGAEAVVACALPVFDKMGQTFSTLLLSSALRNEESMVGQFAKARKWAENKCIEDSSRFWASWTLLHYHGNPYARLPIKSDSESKPKHFDEPHVLSETLSKAGFPDADAMAKAICRRMKNE